MYRIMKRTTKRNEYKCLKCKYHIVKDESIPGISIICNAPNRAYQGKFLARDFYCEEYLSPNEMTEQQYENMMHNYHRLQNKQAFKDYVYKYYDKNTARTMIKKYNEQNK